MKALVALSAVVLFVPPAARAGDARSNELVDLMTQAVRVGTEQLQLVHHAQGAELAAAPLAELNTYLAWMLDRARQAPPDRADRAMLDRFDRAVRELRPEWDRVAADDSTKAVLDRAPALRRVLIEHAGGRPALAVDGIDVLVKAAESYELQFGRPPDTLDQLVTPPAGAKPFVTRDALTDPWGRPYRYDPTGPKGGGVRPDVWSAGPDPADPAGVIGNWQAKAPTGRP